MSTATVINGIDSHAQFQVLAARNSDEAVHIIHMMHGRGYEHYATTNGCWDERNTYLSGGLTLFFRDYDLKFERPPARGGRREARPEGNRTAKK